MRWPGWKRREPQAPAPAAAMFDALIDLGDLPDGVQNSAAREAVTTAVGALPGAGWVSVECHAHAHSVEAELFAPGSALPTAGGAWDALRDRVISAARQAVVALAPVLESPAFETPGFCPAPLLGFAEAMPAGFDALAELAALASTTAPTLDEPGGASDDTAALARLLSFVLPTDGQDTATRAVARFGSMAAVLAAPERELREVPGLGTHSVAAIKLVHEAAVRLLRAGVTGAPVLEESERLRAYLSAALARERVEQFRILFLDEAGRLRADEVQGTGTVNHTPVYPREVMRRAVELRAAAIVLVHNHPSGDPEPSRDDIEVTRQITLAAEALSISVRDHLIIGNGRWLSFREAGLLP